ncbi:hypothetical protein C8J57DRAFT_716090 [Mycena rebaudengoi]|nr:hypothetical protein C8J57DRAFT_716090 [Mycena rebaudengoi]
MLRLSLTGFANLLQALLSPILSPPLFFFGRISRSNTPRFAQIHLSPSTSSINMRRFHPCIVGLVFMVTMTRCTWAAGPAPVPLGTASTSTVAFAPQCTPTVAPCVTVEFAGLTASVEGHDFLTFTLTDTVQECIDLCLCLPGGCAFVNPHLDSTKNTTKLTCAFYAQCHTTEDATNFGGQTQPDGSLSTVSSSSGICLDPC